MGASVSRDYLPAQIQSFIGRSPQPQQNDVVLVPPLFERDFRGRSRMTKSAYDWSFYKPGLKWLFNDYIKEDQVYTLWRLRPSEDPRFTVHSRIAAQNLFGSQLNGLGRMAIRIQPYVSEPLSFIDLKTGTQESPVLRTCAFMLDKGLGVWTSTPLQSVEKSKLGVRYSSPTTSVGIITQPATQEIEHMWLVYKSGDLSSGLQLDLRNRPEPKNPEDLVNLLKQSLSYSIAYSPDSNTGRSNFATAIEIKEQSEMTISLLYHMAVQRNCKNPFEKKGVVGVTNYIDLGLQMKGDLTEAKNGSDGDAEVAKKKSSIALAGSCQVNKNWLLKARLGSESASAAVALKAWWQPSMTFALSATYDYFSRLPKFGFTFGLENYGNIRYERSGERIRVGKALVQRHVALPDDITNSKGEGLLVQEEDLDNKVLLGQTQAASANYL